MYKKKIVCVVPSLARGGAEKMALDLVTYLDKTSFDVVLISLYSDKGEFFNKLASERGVDVYYLDKKPGFDFKTILKLSKLLTSIKPDVIHTHLYSSIYCIPWIGLRAKKTLWVHTVHNIASKELPRPYLEIMKYYYRNKKALPIGISDEIRKTVSTQYQLKEHKIPLIYNGIDTTYFSPEQIIENGENQKQKEVLISCVARFSGQKNHKLLIEAFKDAQNKYSNIKLVLIGDGPLRRDIEEQIESYDLKDKIILTGDSSNVLNWLRKSDVFVLSSDYEGLPISMLEAMSVGVPVIATGVGGVTDVVVNGKEGIIVPPKKSKDLSDAIVTLSSNSEMRSIMGQKARERAMEFDIRKMSEKYGAIYKKDVRDLKEVKV